MHEAMIRRSTSIDRAEGSLRSELAWQAGQARGVLVELVARFGELADGAGQLGQLAEIVRSATADRGDRLKLVIPAEMAAALERGDWSWITAKDGSGFLPTVQSLDGKFAKQVRLVKERIPANPAEIANAAAHAQTHAMLRQILDKLEVMDRKLDLLLAGQRDGWIGQVIAGIRMFRMIAAEPGNPAAASAVLANAIQSLEEGRSIGQRALDSHGSQRPKVPQLLSWPSLKAPSAVRAEWLDARQEEITWIYAASRTLAAIHATQGRPLAARAVMHELGAHLSELQSSWEDVLEFAGFAPERDAFWREQVPALSSARAPKREELVLEVSAAELSAVLGTDTTPYSV